MIKIHLVGGDFVQCDLTFQRMEELLGRAAVECATRIILPSKKSMTVFVDHITLIEEV